MGITQAYKSKVDFMSIAGREADINTTLNVFTYIMLIWLGASAVIETWSTSSCNLDLSIKTFIA